MVRGKRGKGKGPIEEPGSGYYGSFLEYQRKVT